jgi:hypothetical protein
MVFDTSVRDSFKFDSQVLSTFVMAKSLDVEELVIGNKYSISIKTYNPCKHSKRNMTCAHLESCYVRKQNNV